MNDFETRLAEVHLRGAPPEWRGDILRAARAAETANLPQPLWWRGLFSVPKLALAALWLLIGVLRISTPRDVTPTALATTIPISPDMLRAGLQMEASLFAELRGPKPLSPPPKSPNGAMIAGERRRFV